MYFVKKHLINFLTVIAVALVGLVFLWWSNNSYRPKEAKVIRAETAVAERATNTANAAIKQTEDYEMTQTQDAADKTATATLYTPTPTSSLTPTPTHTHTPTVTLTPIPTFTPAPPSNLDCYATIKGEDRYLYPVYGVGQAEVSTIPKGSRVKIVGKPQDGAWYKVLKEDENLSGWLREDILEKDPLDCNVTEYDISYLLEIYDESKELLIDDTFLGDKNNWIDHQGQYLSPTKSENKRLNEWQLELEPDRLPGPIEYPLPGNCVFARPENDKVDDVSWFTLTTSVNRENYGTESFVAFRFRQNSTNITEMQCGPDNTDDKPMNKYMEIRINAACRVDFLMDGNVKDSRELNLESNTCRDYDEDYITLSLDEEGGRIEVQVNDSGPIRFKLPPDESADYWGRVWLGAYDANVRFDFVVITAPR